MNVQRLATVFISVSFLALAATGASAQTDWRPEKTVEIIVPTGAAGTNDQMARLIQKTLQDRKLIGVPAIVLNKPGGNQTLAAVYLNQQAGSPHHLLYSTATLFTNQLAGLTQLRYNDLTPVSLLFVDYTVITVKATSPLKTMRDLVDRLKTDPDSIAFGLVSRGGPNHLAAAQAVKGGGADPKKLKLVVFKTNAESMTALLGEHIQAVVSSVSAALPQVEAGNTRILGIAAPQRQGGKLAQVATMREQGIDASGISNWRAIFAPGGLAPQHVAFWEKTVAQVASSDEWRRQLEANNVAWSYKGHGETVKWLATEYEDTRGVMSELGLVKSGI